MILAQNLFAVGNSLQVNGTRGWVECLIMGSVKAEHLKA